MPFSSSLSGPHLIISIICGQGLQVAGRIPKIKAHKAKLLPGWRLRRIAQISSTNDMQGLSGTSPLSRFDPIRLRLEHDRKDFIGAIGARNALRAPCGDERKPMDVSEDGIRGLRRFGGSSRSLSDLVDAEEVSRHLGITPRRVLSMARKGSIPCVRLSAKTIRFDIEAVDRALGRR